MSTNQKTEAYLKAAHNCLEKELTALSNLKTRLDASFEQAVETIANHTGKIVVCGVGKSGHIGQKVASTLASTGTPAVFMHAAEAVHGDLGIYQPGDPTILISKSGSHSEIVSLVPILKEFDSPIIVLVGNTKSAIARHADIILDVSVPAEADPLGIVPTSSALVTLAMGDALACALMTKRNFQNKDFARFHPAGQLGRNLLNQVKNVMKHQNEIAWIEPEMTFRDVIITMSENPQGAGCVVDAEKTLLGIVTEGDIRRALKENEHYTQLQAKDFMTTNPITVTEEDSLADAIKLMEDRDTQISVLPVIRSTDGVCSGLLRIHDAYQAH